MRSIAATALLVLAAAAIPAGPSHAQAPQPTGQSGRPTIRASVDRVAVDVNVLDRNGRPVPGLEAGDFTLTIDGKPRTVASAQFVPVPTASSATTPEPTDYSSNASIAGGRLVILAIDAGNIESGRGRSAFAAAGRFVAGLNPADRVALVTLPAGPQIDFTSNHALVTKVLESSVGLATPGHVTTRLGLGEALAIERNDETVVAQVVDQQCAGDASAQARDSCLQQLTQEANQLIADARERSRRSIASLRSLFDRLGTSETPKTIVLLSEGLLLEQDFADVAWIGPRASAAHVTLYVLQIDAPDTDAGARRGATRGQDRDALRQGLDVMAGMARGDVFRIVANADFAFQRLATELSGYYLLSFEPQAGDRDDRPHKIKVDVRKKDIEVRARREFSVASAAPASARDDLLDTLRAPLLTNELPLKLTTYALHDAASDSIRTVVAARIDRTIDPDAELSVGYIVIDQTGKVVVNQVERRLATPISPRTQSQTYIGAAITAPGVYTLRLAAVDAKGRRGSVERTFTADLKAIGAVRATDLMIADNSEPGAGGLTPTVDSTFSGDELQAHLELFADAAVLDKTAVALEISDGTSARAIQSAPARVEPVDGDKKHRVAQGGLPLNRLPAGDYIARAVVSVDGRPAGTISRPFRVPKGTDAVAPSPTPPATTTKQTQGFDRMTVLNQPIVGYFLDRLGAVPNASVHQSAIDDVRAGRMAEASRALDGANDTELATAFLKGLVLLSKGELNPAANKFRDALRIDSEFYPAAFYLGACYAAGGREKEAAGAWQMSLVGEGDAPFVYTLLAETLVRLKDAPQAVDVMREAHARWPDDDSVTATLAVTLVSASNNTEAIGVLDPYLARHPDDQERLFLALRLLYDAHTAKRPLISAAEDRARFLRYADAYITAHGAQEWTVARWRRQLEQ